MGKALFIIHDLYQDDNHFPFWAGYLAGALRQDGHECETYCMDVYHYTNDDLAAHLDANKYDLICLSFLAARFVETIIPLSKVINEHKKDAWFVVGGHCASAEPEYIKRKIGADAVVVGQDGERAIQHIMNHKINKWAVNSIVDMFSLSGIKDLPFPTYDLFPMDKYINSLKLFGQTQDEKSLGLVTSRGCIGKCSFCHRLSSRYRMRDMGSVMDEIDLLITTYGVTYFFIQDELFGISKKRMRQFRDALKERGFKIKFACDCRVDIFDEEMCDIMLDAGCQFFDFGFESTSQNVLDLMGKNTTVEQNHKAAQIVRKHEGIGIGVNILWGLPGDTVDSLKSNVDFILKYNTPHQLRTIRPVTPYPGTGLYKKAIADGLLTGPQDFFDKFKNSDLLTVNFTELPNDEFYKHLLDANTHLICLYYGEGTNNEQVFLKGNNATSAFNLIQQFSDLYSGKIMIFRGPRHYPKNKF